jgi:nucleoid-associated protein YgaU
MGLLDFLSGKGKQTPASGAPKQSAEATTKAEEKPAAGAAAAAETFYVVKEGDTLWKIAEAHYGAGKGAKYMEIFEANRPLLSDPDRIQPGQRLRIPNATTGPLAAGEWQPPAEIAGKQS